MGGRIGAIESWRCQSCSLTSEMRAEEARCVLCGHQQGMMCPVSLGDTNGYVAHPWASSGAEGAAATWAHVVCVHYLGAPLFLSSAPDMQSSPVRVRRRLLVAATGPKGEAPAGPECQLCDCRTGGEVRCAVDGCPCAYHPSCALVHGLDVDLRSGTLLCQAHSRDPDIEEAAHGPLHSHDELFRAGLGWQPCHICKNPKPETLGCTALGCQNFYCRTHVERFDRGSFDRMKLDPDWKCFSCRGLCDCLECRDSPSPVRDGRRYGPCPDADACVCGRGADMLMISCPDCATWWHPWCAGLSDIPPSDWSCCVTGADSDGD